jgi:hypothetical protein
LEGSDLIFISREKEHACALVKKFAHDSASEAKRTACDNRIFVFELHLGTPTAKYCTCNLSASSAARKAMSSQNTSRRSKIQLRIQQNLSGARFCQVRGASPRFAGTGFFRPGLGLRLCSPLLDKASELLVPARKCRPESSVYLAQFCVGGLLLRPRPQSPGVTAERLMHNVVATVAVVTLLADSF